MQRANARCLVLGVLLAISSLVIAAPGAVSSQAAAYDVQTTHTANATPLHSAAMVAPEVLSVSAQPVASNAAPQSAASIAMCEAFAVKGETLNALDQWRLCRTRVA